MESWYWRIYCQASSRGLTCPGAVLRIVSVMNTTNYANQIVTNLEAKGYSKDMVIGYLEGTINGLRYLENKKVEEYLARTVKETQP